MKEFANLYRTFHVSNELLTFLMIFSCYYHTFHVSNELSTLPPKFSALSCFFQSRAPLPNGMNVVFRYYIDWTIQLCGSIIYFTVLLLSALFFIGMCLYIGRMADDLRTALEDVNEDTRRQLINQIVFHNELLQ